METISFEEVAKAVNGQLIGTDKNTRIRGVSTDSRNIQNGDLFFAIQGEHFNGHQFIVQAIDAGAAGVVISREHALDLKGRSSSLIQVANTVTALGDLAKYYRQKLDTQIIGITGSNGKTTTKEMTYHLLSYFSPTVKSQKSFNNLIGVPITIFEIENRHRYGVLEMGTNAPGEILRLSEIGNPDVAAIVNISKTHLEGLVNIEGVAQAKGEILENIRTGGVFVYNADNPWCVTIANRYKGKSVSFGFSHHAQIKCTDVKEKNTGYRVTINGYLDVYIPIPGNHNINNCLASFAVCYALGHDLNDLKDVLSSFTLPSMRMEQQCIGNITVINDAYNANPESVSAALRYLREINTMNRRVFICGDMLELGKESCQLHREVGEKVAHLNIDVLWTVGEHAYEIARAAKLSGMPERRIMSFKEVADISGSEIHTLKENDTVLIKGSRGMHMEKVVEKFKEFFLTRELSYNCF